MERDALLPPERGTETWLSWIWAVAAGAVEDAAIKLGSANTKMTTPVLAEVCRFLRGY